MTDTADLSPPPPAVHRPPRWQISLIWLVPLVAALVGLGLIARAWLQAGPVLTLSFKSAEGLEAGSTEVRFKDVVIGKVRRIDLSDDFDSVVVTVDLKHEAERVAVQDSRFWVVRPRADFGGVSGLGTLLSGAYIGVDIGQSEQKQRSFVALEVPPPITNDRVGRSFRLQASDLGSINLGSPVYYRRLPVGRIVSYELAADGRGISLQAFVDAPYDRFVTARSRFWNASGIDLSLGAQGFKLNTQSLFSVLAGGVAFWTPEQSSEAVPKDMSFELYGDMATALAPKDGVRLATRMRFYQSVRGLTVGSPVDFHGLSLGEVTVIDFEYDATRKRFATDVSASIYPERLGHAYLSLRAQNGQQSPEDVFRRLVAQGLRAQMRSGNLLTGQQYVALDFLPKEEATLSPVAAGELQLPTVPGSFDQIQSQIAAIVAKFEKVPFDQIGEHLRDSLRDADRLLLKLDTELAPELKQTLAETRKTMGAANDALAADAPLQQDLRGTLESVDRAARSLRGLTETLQRHPEALLRGKPDDPEPPPAEALPPTGAP
ncbi:MAG TPA: MlaD family protein [Solimonas sp.]|nr:MlaD family protein [Solimonas sp.]